jgi:hypothetical protein
MAPADAVFDLSNEGNIPAPPAVVYARLTHCSPLSTGDSARCAQRR